VTPYGPWRGILGVIPLLVLVIGAGLLRLREIATVPTWTDEVRESLIALDIATGRAFPLVNVHAYIGALWNYLVAAAFWLFGFDPALPRVVVLAFGLGTIVAAYLLGRQLGGPTTGLIAAGLLAVSGADVLVSSRIAYSHSLTPLFVTLTLWLLLRAPRHGGPSLALAGLCCGLALQTHVTAAALLPAIGAYAVGRYRSWSRRWVLLATLLLLGAYANVLLYNLLDGWRGLRQGIGAADLYAEGRGTGLELIATNTRDLLLLFLRLLSGAVDVRPVARDYLIDPLVLAAVALFLVGLVVATRRVSSLPLLVLVAFAVVIVAVNGKYQVMPNGRFLMPVLPLSLALVGLGIGECARRLTSRRPAHGAVAALLAGVLGLASLARLEARLGDFEATRANSAALSAGVDELVAARQPSEPVLLDQLLRQLPLDGGGHYHMALLYRLRLAGASVASVELRRPQQRSRVEPCVENRAVVQPLRLGDGDPLERLLPDSAAQPRGSTVWIVRVAVSGDPPPTGALVIPHRPPIDGFSLAADGCANGRLI
jgi:4-amino-4-deoxy-L-arabinose transferase-like glycosyltransferase